MDDETLNVLTVGFLLAMIIVAIEAGLWIVPIMLAMLYWCYDMAGRGDL